MKWTLDLKIQMNKLKGRSVYLQTYKEMVPLIKTYEELWSLLSRFKKE